MDASTETIFFDVPDMGSQHKTERVAQVAAQEQAKGRGATFCLPATCAGATWVKDLKSRRYSTTLFFDPGLKSEPLIAFDASNAEHLAALGHECKLVVGARSFWGSADPSGLVDVRAEIKGALKSLGGSAELLARVARAAGVKGARVFPEASGWINVEFDDGAPGAVCVSIPWLWFPAALGYFVEFVSGARCDECTAAEALKRIPWIWKRW